MHVVPMTAKVDASPSLLSTMQPSVPITWPFRACDSRVHAGVDWRLLVVEPATLGNRNLAVCQPRHSPSRRLPSPSHESGVHKNKAFLALPHQRRPAQLQPAPCSPRSVFPVLDGPNEPIAPGSRSRRAREWGHLPSSRRLRIIAVAISLPLLSWSDG